MPLPVFTLVGSTLDATIVDGNFELLRKYLQEQVVGGDISPAEIDRWVFRQMSGGKVSAATIRANEVLDFDMAKDQSSSAFHEQTWRDKDQATSIVSIGQRRHTMELLGKPGPSFYFQFQEDGIVYAGAPSQNRYDKSYCHSLWKTVPFTSMKIYVPEPCVARIHGRAYCLASMVPIATYMNWGPGNDIVDWERTPPATPNRTTLGNEIAMRLGLFVDTNPNLHSDEFTNSNPNILNPVSGAQAAHCSWKEVKSKTIGVQQWTREDISGEVVLKGRRWYNFSMKYRGAGALGYRAAGADPFIDDIFEYDSYPLPNYNGVHQPMIGTPPFEVHWISTSLHLEFLYGLGSIVDDTSLITVTP